MRMTSKNPSQTALDGALASPIRAGLIEVLPHSDDLADRLSTTFPFCGSKIDWRATRGHCSGRELSRDRELVAFADFFDRRSKELGRDSIAYYVNDNQVDWALRASLWTFSRHLEAITEIPGHHYFVADDLGWCMALTMEGDIDFGFAPAGVR